MLYNAITCICVVAAFVSGCKAGHIYLSKARSNDSCRATAMQMLGGLFGAIICHFICRTIELPLLADICLAATLFCAGALMELAHETKKKEKRYGAL